MNKHMPSVLGLGLSDSVSLRPLPEDTGHSAVVQWGRARGFPPAGLSRSSSQREPCSPGGGSRGDGLRPDRRACDPSFPLSLSAALGKVLTSLLLTCKMGQ